MKNLTLGARLGLGFAIVLALLLALAATSITRMQAAGDLTYRLVNTSMKNQRDIAEWRRHIEVNTAIDDAVYYGADASILDTNDARRKAITARLDVLQVEIDAALKNPGVREQFKVVKQERAAYLAAREALFAARRSGDQAQLDAVYRTNLAPHTASYVADVEKFAGMQITATSAIATTILDSYASTRAILLALSAAALGFGAACAWFITRSITTPLRAAVAVAERVAGGDLTSQFATDRHDEVGQLMAALRRMNTSLADIVGQVRDRKSTRLNSSHWE